MLTNHLKNPEGRFGWNVENNNDEEEDKSSNNLSDKNIKFHLRNLDK